MAYPYFSLQGAPPPVARWWIPGGDLGTFATLGTMRHVVNASLAHPRVRAIVGTVLGETRDPAAVWLRLRAWLADHFTFTPDPPDAETVRTPPEQLAQIDTTGVMRGDCDDAATLAATLAKAAGQRVRFVVLGFFDRAAPYQHVYAEMATPQGWREFDVTRGRSRLQPSRAATVEV